MVDTVRCEFYLERGFELASYDDVSTLLLVLWDFSQMGVLSSTIASEEQPNIVRSDSYFTVHVSLDTVSMRLLYLAYQIASINRAYLTRVLA